MKKFLVALLTTFTLLGCSATAPRGDVNLEMKQKQFNKPESSIASLYIYRGQEGLLNSDVITKRKIWVNGQELGGLIINSYFYFEVEPGVVVVETESEFGNNELTFQAAGGQFYFIEQNLKMGAITSGAELNLTYENRGKSSILSSKLLKQN